MPSHCDVLVVDDHPINRNLASRILAQAGLTSAVACSGEEAIDAALQLLPLVILMDVVMPGMDGYEACRQLKAHEKTAAIPVIFVTAQADVQAETLCFECGGADFVTKPYNAAVLRARIRTQIAVSANRRSLEGMFRDVIEFAPAVFLMSDAAGHLVKTNALALQQFAVTRADMLDSRLDRWIPEIYTQMPGGALPLASEHFEMDCRRADGTRFPADITYGFLQTSQEPLGLFIIRDIEAHRHTLTELHDSRARVRALGAQNESAREDERKRIAREVHDELGQVMTALRMDIALMEMLYLKQVPDMQDKLVGMRGLVDRAISGVRQIASNLRPPALDMGLGAAVQWLVSEFKKHSPANVGLRLSDVPKHLPEQHAMTIYRIVQEALNNIAKYAQATQVEITLETDGKRLHLLIQDNGVGFMTSQLTSRKTFGLLGMQERAMSLGGDLSIQSQPNEGTLIEANFVVEQVREEAA